MSKASNSNGNGGVAIDLFTRLDEFHDLMAMLVTAHVSHESFLAYTSKMYVTVAVEQLDGNQHRAAEQIGLHRNSVRRILHGVRPNGNEENTTRECEPSPNVG